MSPLSPEPTICREPDCTSEAIAEGYCRLHYILHWKQLQRKHEILAQGILNQAIEELLGRLPEEVIPVLRQDLSTDDSLAAVIDDLEIWDEEQEAEQDLDEDLGRLA